MSLAGDVSLKSIKQQGTGTPAAKPALVYYDEELAVSGDTDDASYSSPKTWEGRFLGGGPGSLTSSPSKLSLLSVHDDAQLDELDEACTILNDLHFKGVISKQEKQNRRALVISFMEFQAADYDDGVVQVQSFGPIFEVLRSSLGCVVGCYRSLCPCCLNPEDERGL